MYRWVDHTSEVELEIEADDPERVFAEAVAAIAELLAGDGSREGAAETRTVRADGPDRPALLAAFIEELVFLAESQSLVPLRAERVELGERDASADVAFARREAPHLVKAVTYHRLEFEPAGAGYRARVVLDV